MAATRTVQKMRHISVTSHIMKTNDGSTLRFSGTGNALVALFLSFKVKVTSWINVIFSHQQVKICHISVTCPDINPNNGSTPMFSGTGKPLVPLLLCVKVTPWVNAMCHVSHQKVKICHISVACHHKITINGYTPLFSGMGNPLVPLVL